MKVKELIDALKHFPKDSVVVFQDHDQNEDEINAEIDTVRSEPEVVREDGLLAILLKKHKHAVILS